MTRLIARLREVEAHEVDDSGELIVHDAHGEQLLVLNQVGAAIYELLDGERDLAQVAAIVAQTLELPLDAVRADVETFLYELSDRGIAELREVE